MRTRHVVVLFDVVETLFPLEPLRGELVEIGLAPADEDANG